MNSVFPIILLGISALLIATLAKREGEKQSAVVQGFVGCGCSEEPAAEEYYGPSIERVAPPEFVEHFTAIASNPLSYTRGEIKNFVAILDARGLAFEGDYLAAVTQMADEQLRSAARSDHQAAALYRAWVSEDAGRFTGGVVRPFGWGGLPSSVEPPQHSPAPPPTSLQTVIPPALPSAGTTGAPTPKARPPTRFVNRLQELEQKVFDGSATRAETDEFAMRQAGEWVEPAPPEAKPAPAPDLKDEANGK